jgi:glycosyltransferase involved in cell wall biosynthesis
VCCFANAERDIDVLFVGKFADYKRPLELLNPRLLKRITHGGDDGGQRPRVVAVGDWEPLSAYPEGPQLVSQLVAGGVEVWPPVPYAQLARLYRRARAVLIPCNLLGGGEVGAEARRCEGGEMGGGS